MSPREPLNTHTHTSRWELEVLTAVHVGSGNEIDPLSYLVEPGDGNEEPHMKRFSLERLIPRLLPEGRRDLMRIIDGEGLSETERLSKLRKALVTTFRDLEGRGTPLWDYTAAVTAEVNEVFQQHKDDPNNQLLIDEMMRDSRGSPYLPGSSLKGALRTAVLQPLVQQNPEAVERNRLNEGRLLGYKGAQADPFRAFRLTDVCVSGDRREFVCPGRVWNPHRETGSPQIFLEALRGRLVDGDAHGRLDVELDNRAFEAARSARDLGPWKPPRERLTSLPSILSAAHQYYSDLFEEEFNHFYLSADDREARDAPVELKEVIDNLDGSTEFLLRLGRFSQREAVTVSTGARRFGRTRTLLSYRGRLIPAGWVILRQKQLPAPRKRVVARVKRRR